MNIEEVIAKLIDIKSEHVNLNVLWHDSEYGYFSVNNFNVHNIGIREPETIVGIS